MVEYYFTFDLTEEVRVEVDWESTVDVGNEEAEKIARDKLEKAGLPRDLKFNELYSQH